MPHKSSVRTSCVSLLRSAGIGISTESNEELRWAVTINTAATIAMTPRSGQRTGQHISFSRLLAQCRQISSSICVAVIGLRPARVGADAEQEQRQETRS